MNYQWLHVIKKKKTLLKIVVVNPFDARDSICRSRNRPHLCFDFFKILTADLASIFGLNMSKAL